MNNIFKHLVGISLCALALTSCSDDEDSAAGQTGPIEMQAKILEEGENDLTWANLLDRRVAVSIDSEVKKYLVDTSGKLSASDPFDWAGRRTVRVEAWYPYQLVKPAELLVKPNQNIPSMYQASNLMSADEVEQSANGGELLFRHLVSKMVCRLSQTTGDAPATTRAANNDPFKGVRLTLLNMKGVEQGTSIQMSAEFKAFVVDQIIIPGNEILEIAFPDGHKQVITADEEFSLDEGEMYHMDITMDENEGVVEWSISQAPAWEGDSEETAGGADGTNTGTGSDDWGNGGSENSNGSSEGTNSSTGSDDWGNGGSENSNGSSEGTNSSTGSDDWGNGGSEDTNGSSSGTDSNTGSDDWGNGSSEDTNGSSEDTNSNTGDGNWNGSDENTEGSTNDTNSDTGDGNWEGSGENAEGSTNDTNGDGTNGKWDGNGDSEDITGTKDSSSSSATKQEPPVVNTTTIQSEKKQK